VATTTNLNGDVSTINGANGGNFSITGDVVTAAGLTLTTNHGGGTDGTFEIIGVVTAAGALTMNVGPGNDISLNDPLNNLPGVITIPFGQDVSLYTRGSIVLGTINVRNLSVYAGRIIAGGITQSGILGTSLGDIDLSTQPNNIAGVITVGSLPNVRDLAIWNISTNAAVPSFPLTNLQNVTLNFPNCAITLPPINILGFLSVTSGGDITDSGTLTIAGTVTMDSNGNNITLDDDGIGGYTNTFGILSLTGTGADIVVYEAAESTYSSITAATLTAYSTAGDIISSGAWNITGDTTLNAAIDISVGNGSSLGTLYLTGGNVTINENDPTVLGTSNASDLFITSTGEITDSGVLNVTGTSSFTVTGADIITLDSGNTYTDSVTLSSGTGAVSITTAASTVDLAASTLGGNLTVASVGGDITDSGILSITGITSYTVTGTNIITMDSGNTYTGSVTLSSGTGGVSIINAASAVDLASSTLGGNLTVATLSGDITDSGTLLITGNSTFTAADTFSIYLDDPANNFIGAATVSFLSGGPGNLSNITVVDQDQFDIQGLTINGNLNVTTAGAITQSGPINTGGNIYLISSASTIAIAAAAPDTITTGAGGNVTITNNGLLSIGNGADLSLGGTFTQNGAGLVDISSNISTTTANISFLQGVTLSGDVVLSTGVGAGDILFSSTITGATNNLSLYPYDGLCTVSGVVTGINTLNIHDNNAGSTGAILFSDSITADTVVTQAFLHDITLNNGGTITNLVTFSNTGILTLGNASGDTFNFTGGIIATVPTSKNIAGTIRAAGTGVIDLSTTPINITSDSTIGGTSTGAVTLADITMVDGITLTLGASVNTPYLCGAINGAVGPPVSDLVISTLGTVTLSGAIGTDIGNLTISSGNLDAAGNTITLTENWNNTGGIFTHNGNTVTLGNGGAATNTIRSNGSPFNDLIIDITDTYSLLDDMEIDNSLTTNGSFQPGNSQVTFNGTTWTTTLTGTFNHNISSGTSSIVQFTNPGTITVTGDNTFYKFDYQVAGGTILFGNGDLQTFINDFTVIGALGNEITLNSDDDNQSWFIEIYFPSAGGSATATIEHVFVRNSFANNPITPDTTCTDGGGNTNWYFFIEIIVSWTEDSDLNGRIDRIRVRVDNSAVPDLTDSLDSIGGTGFAPGYSDLDAFVDGYDLDPVTPFSDSDTPITTEFFINLVEKEYTDTDVTPSWRLTENTSLKNKSGGALVEFGDLVSLETPLDNAAPVVNYTLASAEKDKIFIQFSEYIQQPGGSDPVIGNFNYTGAGSVTGLTGITTISSGGMKEIELSLDSPVTVDEILAGTILNSTGSFDDMNDWIPLADYPEADQTPLPSVPVDFDDSLLIPSVFAHRVSDLALGLTGDGIIQPVHARDEAETNSDRGGIGLIRDFTGGEWLQDQAIEITSHINNDHSTASTTLPDVRLQFDVDVSASYRQDNSEDGLWLPSTYDVLYFYGIVPSPNPDDRTISMGASPSDNLRIHDLDNDDSEIVSVSDVEFLYYLPVENLYAARIENSSASDWFRQIKPWTFSIHDITEQVGGVTILKNVINPENGETTKLHYQLAKAGMVTVQVFDISGALVDVLQRGRQEAGDYSTAWDGRNSGGRVVARGVYFIRVVAPDMDETRKVMVVK